MVRLGPRPQSNRLRAGYLHLKKAIDEVVGMVSMDDDGNPAGVDAVLTATMEECDAFLAAAEHAVVPLRARGPHLSHCRRSHRHRSAATG